MERWDKEKLKQIWQLRQKKSNIQPLKACVDTFLRRKVIPRQKKLAQLAGAWCEVLPEELTEHSCLEGFRGGTLRVLVDSSVHLAELDLMVREGLTDQLRDLCPGVPLSKIRLVRGYWYHTDEEGNKIPDYN